MASPPREVWGDLATTAFVEASLLFRSLDPDARADLLKLATQITWEAGEVASPEGDDAFLLVLDGAAAVRVGTPAGPVEVGHLERGGFHGSGALLGSSRAWSLAARTELTAVAFPAPVVGAMLERFPKAKKLLEALTAAREKEAAERLGG
jgi:CRP-like cAMP-binding protein